MLAVQDLIAKADWGQLGEPEVRFHGQPLDESRPVLLWDGEWEVTYVTFRDMGAAFAVAILGIPIFQGLAVSLLFGLASSTLLTVLVIPAIYIVLRDDHRPLPPDDAPATGDMPVAPAPA
jgi:hypothetical protein